MTKRQVISAERLVVGDVITALVDSKGRRAEEARPRKVTGISPEFPGSHRTLLVGTRAGSKSGMRVFDRDEQVEIEVQR